MGGGPSSNSCSSALTTSAVLLRVSETTSFRRRCCKQSTATRRTSSSVTSSRLSRAANARAVLLVTISPRSPSTFNLEQTLEIFTAMFLGIFTFGSRSLASRTRALKASSWAAQTSSIFSGACDHSKARVSTSLRQSAPSAVRMLHVRPKRSRSCGLKSPSSGCEVPTSTKRAGCRTLTPSRSTVFTPPAALSSRTSTSWSSRRLHSSM
mmetsp:Transcript_38901/g.72336  ORF Transcript_38901/g.72336 Transcript_38901/m.72336 type:complete len:209 (-) Transcript_38901:747-1373(-)